MPQDSLKDAQILARLPLPAFDACQVGVVLRAVLLVQVVMAVAALFGAVGALDWAQRLLLLTVGAFPATLVWLLATCACGKLLARWAGRAAPALHYSLGLVLGALAGAYGCALLRYLGLVSISATWASAAAGALLAAQLMAAMTLRERARVPAATAARLAELQSRIRPHFLFNTLNSAIALVRLQPARAEAVLEDLSELFRHALVEHGASVPLAQEVHLAQRYLAIEQVRFGERLQVQWQLDPEAQHTRLPPLLLQPLLENAVKHGVEPSASGGHILVHTQRRAAMVVLEITNTLPNAAPATDALPKAVGSHASSAARSGHGMALANVRDRLHLLHDVQIRFQSGLHEGRYRVRIELPWNGPNAHEEGSEEDL